MLTLADIKDAFRVNEMPKEMKLTVEGSYIVDYKDWNGSIQLIRIDENLIHSNDDLVTVAELLNVFSSEEFDKLPIADEDGKVFEQAAATKTKLDFRYENK